MEGTLFKIQLTLAVLLCSSSLALANSCEDQHTISRVILSLTSRLPTVIGSEHENLFFSPLSISVALAMIYVGTQGRTKSEMSEALDYKFVGDKCLDLQVSEGFRSLLQSLGSSDERLSVLIANSVFMQLGYTVSPNYLSRLHQFFNTDVKYTDFNKEEELTMRRINDWVANQTRGQIAKILNEPLDPMTIMILMNVVYFKGIWKHPFNESRTRRSFFFKSDGSTAVVPFMFLQKEFYFLFDSATNTSYLEMDYKGGNITMLLVLPENNRQIPRMDSISEVLCTVKPRMDVRTVQVAIPKFKMEYTREMSRDMMSLGMPELFSERADLSGIRDQKDLHVSLMIHKAVIEVDEKGSEASAVSGVGIYGRVNNNRPQTFWANHPFLFYIIDKRMETVLFAGRVMQP